MAHQAGISGRKVKDFGGDVSSVGGVGGGEMAFSGENPSIYGEGRRKIGGKGGRTEGKGGG